MYIQPCPRCGRFPKITQGIPFKDGTKRWFIGCPNYCHVLKSRHENGFDLKETWTIVYGDIDKNTIYKQWNQELDLS